MLLARMIVTGRGGLGSDGGWPAGRPGPAVPECRAVRECVVDDVNVSPLRRVTPRVPLLGCTPIAPDRAGHLMVAVLYPRNPAHDRTVVAGCVSGHYPGADRLCVEGPLSPALPALFHRHTEEASFGGSAVQQPRRELGGVQADGKRRRAGGEDRAVANGRVLREFVVVRIRRPEG